LIIAIACNLCCHAQKLSDYFILDTALVLPANYNQIILAEPRFCDQGIGFLLEDELSPNVVQYDLLTRKGNTISSKRILIPDTILADKRIKISDFRVKGTYLVIKAWKYILIYHMMTSSEFMIKNVLATRNNYSKIQLLDSTLILTGCGYNSENIDSTFHTYIGSINCEQGRIIYEKQLPDPQGIMFMRFQPRHIIDVSNNNLLISDITRYQIKVFDRLLLQTAVLERKPKEWLGASDLGYKRFVTNYFLNHPREMLDSLRSYYYSLSLIEFAKFINDSTILVGWNTTKVFTTGLLEKTKILCYDIWVKRNNVWTLLAYDMHNINPALDSSPSTTHTFPLLQRFDMVDSHVAGVEQISVPLWNDWTYEKIKNEEEKYLQNNDANYTLFLYQYRCSQK